MTCRIPLAGKYGGYALVDYADLAAIRPYTWYNTKTRTTAQKHYAVSSVYDGQKQRLAYMHIVVMQAKGIDHKNGDGLDNRRSNLRKATASQNSCNRGRQLNNRSGCKGVSWYSVTQKWRAAIRVKGKYLHLGYFSSKESAAFAYRTAAKQHHGEFART